MVVINKLVSFATLGTKNNCFGYLFYPRKSELYASVAKLRLFTATVFQHRCLERQKLSIIDVMYINMKWLLKITLMKILHLAIVLVTDVKKRSLKLWFEKWRKKRFERIQYSQKSSIKKHVESKSFDCRFDDQIVIKGKTNRNFLGQFFVRVT